MLSLMSSSVVNNNSSSELSTIQNYLHDQEKKLYNLEHHINRMTRQFGKRERILLSEIAKLHHELRDQTVKFQERLLLHDDDSFLRQNSSSASSSTSPTSFNELPPVEEEVYSEETTSNFCLDEEEGAEIFYVRLKRGSNGSLGFNVVGGNSAEPDCDQGVYVSRILAECPESTKALQPYDRILKVNGQDVSQTSHHEAVESFKTAKDPVVVQVYRRLNSSSSATKIRHDRHSDMSLITTSTQTDPITDDDEDDMLNENTALLGGGGCSSKNFDENGVLEYSRRTNNKLLNSSTQVVVVGSTPIVPDPSLMAQLELAADGFIDDTDLDEECRQQLYDVEYEEVTLKRSSDGEKLGLTLCYGCGDNVDTDIFVGEIEPESVADKDGRIKAGDQILQINGVDVHTRNRAIELFGRENSDITLLLARNSNGESLRDIVHSVPRLQETIDEERSSSFMQDQIFEEDDGVLTDGTRGSGGSAHEKDSGISRTTDSEPDLPPPINSSPSKYSQSSTASSGRTGPSCGTGKEVSTPENATGGSVPNVGGSAARSPCVSSERSFAANDLDKTQNQSLTKRSDSESSLERELHNLHREMEFIQVECDRLIEQHARAERQVRQQMDQANKLAETMDNFQKQQILTSSSSSQQQNKAKPTSSSSTVYLRERNKSALTPPPHLKNGRRFMDCTTETNDIRYRNGVKGITMDSNAIGVVGRLSREETSSAYNTGNESCRSTPLNMSDAHLKTSRNFRQRSNLYDHQNEYETIADEEDGKRDSAVFTLPLRNNSTKNNSSPSSKLSPRQCGDKSELSSSTKFLNGNKVVSAAVGVGVRLNAAEISGILRQCTSSNVADVSSSSQFALGDVMYTNPENLQQTILLQQRLLRQAMIQQAHQLKAQQAFGKGPVPFYETYQSCDAKLEWKVKRRSDGSRYITKRPVRNKMLKERAQQLSNERVGVSTDDDAMSELKIGRYWSKDERKKHLERQKERKKRQEELIRRQNESLQQSNDQPILQLSHKKMMRRQGQQLLDKFTTVQEFLSHGARTVDGKRAFGILSVTTV